MQHLIQLNKYHFKMCLRSLPLVSITFSKHNVPWLISYMFYFITPVPLRKGCMCLEMQQITITKMRRSFWHNTFLFLGNQFGKNCYFSLYLFMPLPKSIQNSFLAICFIQLIFQASDFSFVTIFLSPCFGCDICWGWWVSNWRTYLNRQ